MLNKWVLEHLKKLFSQFLKLFYELILDHMMWISHYFMPSFFFCHCSISKGQPCRTSMLVVLRFYVRSVKMALFSNTLIFPLRCCPLHMTLFSAKPFNIAHNSFLYFMLFNEMVWWVQMIWLWTCYSAIRVMFSFCQLRFDVPQLYKFHKKKGVDIAVDLWRFVPKVNQGKGD